jgi:uncharacterized protein YndB with AHSA1/START domain
MTDTSRAPTPVTIHIKAPRVAVYRALTDAAAIAEWRAPDDMTSHVHEFDAREGGAFRISLTYEDATRAGKTESHTDTYHGHFAELVPDEKVVEVMSFETTDPDLLGEMTITTTLSDADGGTDVAMTHEGLPRGVSASDNETGTRMALAHLAALVESG